MSGGCNGCYNGCADITSDQCVKYTGDAITALGIEVGDPLSEVIDKLVTYLLTVIDGTGIEPVVTPAEVCTLIDTYLADNGAGATLPDILTAFAQAICDLQAQVTADVANMTTLNADYTIPACLTVAADAGTHAVLQAVITKLCATVLDVTALQAALSAYVEIADLDGLIQDYLDSIEVDLYYNKMVPYVAVEYYGALSGYPTISDGFNANGEGYGAWLNVHLCNGLGGTPDKRGRIPVGCTSMRVGGFNINVDPAIAGNPTYAAPEVVNGTNKVTITSATMPPHTHTATSTVNDSGHRHVFGGDEGLFTLGGYTKSSSTPISFNFSTDYGSHTVYNYYTKDVNGNNVLQTTGISVSTANANTGGGLSHDNVPPVMACYYIMYIP